MAQIRKLIELPLCHPQLFKSIGIKPPCGILMFGPPGTGKTLMARVVANETGAFFFLINSPEIMSKMAGESESNLRKAFEEAEKNLPAIIFVDEIDFIAPKRDKVTEEEMDGTNTKKNVFIIGATNRPDQINSTLLRPRRLDQLIYIPLPTEVSRLAILKAALKKSPISQEVDLAFLAKQTHGFSGADLTEICQRAAKLAIHESIESDIRRQRELKEKEDAEDAKMEVPSHPNLPYLDGVIHEILRLHPPLDEFTRFAAADDVIPLSEPSLHFKRASKITQGSLAAKKIKLSTAQTSGEDAIPSQSDVPTQASSTPGAASGSSGYTLPGLSSSRASQTPQPLPALHPSTELREHSLLEEQPQAEPSTSIPIPEDIHPSRPTRSHRLPMRFRDKPPVPPPPIPQSPPSTLPRVILHVFGSFRTSLNQFGIGREYRHRPTHDPDAFVSADQLSNFYPNLSFNTELEATSSSKAPPWPWRNMSVWRLMTWMLSGSNQSSEAQVTRLVREVISAEDFKVDDVKGFNAHTEMGQVAAEILVPTREKNPNSNGQVFTVPGFQYRPLTAVIHASFSEATSKWFHFTPFKRFWRSPVTSQEQRLYDELYTSDAWIQAHDDLQKQRRDDGCKLEKVIAGLMFWSDSTHLAQFGNASAWPVYLYFGNQSKYTRACPTSGVCHPVAFIPTLPESIKQFIATITLVKRKSYHDILAHCKREMFHAIWCILIDDDFLNAYRDGIIIKCHDGVYRRVFPRIFTYSADYPEKVLIAAIRDKGVCPCPRCLLPKSYFGRIGLHSDMSGRVARVYKSIKDTVIAARNAIYKLGAPIKGAAVERLLKEFSLVPTVRLGPLGFDCFPMLVVDLLHEFELGVFKSVFKHLIRLLYAINPEWIVVLNERFRSIPSFGKGAIRRFPTNVSDVRQNAARHFEDVLQVSLAVFTVSNTDVLPPSEQCTIPAFEGLFPKEHDDVIRLLLFRLAEWHTLAKLRLHTDDSLNKLDQALNALGSQLRRFQKFTCSAFRTMELPREVAARQRRQDANLQSTNQDASASSARVKTVLKRYQIQRASASARALCPLPEYVPLISE
ncbi:hypothetical protein F4604DRAFT_1981657 [Suillus subluteus]|nr:hypothetical protein F4604DRAFT_1981657 [Suillus subluteus]